MGKTVSWNAWEQRFMALKMNWIDGFTTRSTELAADVTHLGGIASKPLAYKQYKVIIDQK